MSVAVRRYGSQRNSIDWVRAMLAGFVGALEGASEPDAVLDETGEMPGHIRNGAAV